MVRSVVGASQGVYGIGAARSGGGSPVQTNPMAILAKQAEIETGIPAGILEKLQLAAQHCNCIIGIRGIHSSATGLMAEGGYPGKPLEIKGKSSDWGPQASFICVDQKYSKLANASSGKVAFYDGQTAACIKKHDAVAVPLTIGEKRLRDLLALGAIRSLKGSGDVIEIEAEAPGGGMHSFTATRQASQAEDTFLIKHKDGRPVEVLADPESKKPFIPDLDLVMVAPHLNDFDSGKDRRRLPETTYERFVATRLSGPTRKNSCPVGISKKLQSINNVYGNEDTYYKGECPNLGNVSPRIKALLSRLNQAVGQKLFLHSDDAHNPFSDHKTNYPSAFVLPVPLEGHKEICVVDNHDDMYKLCQAGKNAHYEMPTNPGWGLPQVRRGSFSSAQRIIEATIKNGHKLSV